MSDAVEPPDDRCAPVAVDFIARLGAAMLAADYPVTSVRRVLTHAADWYRLPNRLQVLPNFIQVGESADTRMEHVDDPLRYDQAFPLGDLVRLTDRGKVTAASGSAELDRILALPRPIPPWVSVIGYMVQSAAYALILQPTPIGLTAATGFGLLVGVLDVVTRTNAGVRHLLPAISAFLVTFIAFSLGRWLDLGQDSLRVLIPPLTLFLPGVGITLALQEAGAGAMISAAARLTAGLTRLAQLALGIVFGIQLVGLSRWELTVAPVNKIGPWAPWLGVAVYAVGIMLYFGPPRRFTPWLLIVLYVSYGSQLATAKFFGSYASGFGGGLVLMLVALVLSELRTTPNSNVMLAPGFWLMVPSSVGLIGVAELANGGPGNPITVMLVSMLSIALGFQAGHAIWDLLPYRVRRFNDAGY
jgi:uncharacterized membrane protein YjjP (DUF1212 family)